MMNTNTFSSNPLPNYPFAPEMMAGFVFYLSLILMLSSPLPVEFNLFFIAHLAMIAFTARTRASIELIEQQRGTIDKTLIKWYRRFRLFHPYLILLILILALPQYAYIGVYLPIAHTILGRLPKDTTKVYISELIFLGIAGSLLGLTLTSNPDNPTTLVMAILATQSIGAVSLRLLAGTLSRFWLGVLVILFSAILSLTDDLVIFSAGFGFLVSILYDGNPGVNVSKKIQ